MKRRLAISIVLLFTVLAIGIAVAVSFMRQASSEVSELVRLYQIEGRRHNLELVIQRAQQDLLVSETVFANNLDSVIRNVRRLDHAIEVCASCHHEPSDKRFLDDTAGRIDDYKQSWSRFITARGGEEFRIRLQLETSQQGGELLSLVQEMRQTTASHLESRTREVMRNTDRAWWSLGSTLLATGLIGLLSALIMARRATAAHSKLLTATHRIAEGRLGATVEHLENGEIGELIDAFNRMSTSLLEQDRDVGQRTEELRQTRDIALFTLARLAESRDPETGRHLERIAAYSLRLARELQAAGPYADEIDETFLDQIHKSSPLHDIGKVGIHDSILLKEGPLTPEEVEIMRTHARIGGDTLRSVVDQFEAHEFLRMAMEIAYAHHEKWDGSGYPKGLYREEIPLPARIVALADAYDAITSTRPYESALGHNEAIRRIVGDCGSQFDPVVVEAFMACEVDFLRLRDVAPEVATSADGRTS